MKATHVIMGGIVFPWADKAPYTDSGHSVLGALEYDKVHDVIKCHVCGAWVQRIGGTHLRADGVSVREYRATYGLRQSTPLCTPSYSSHLRERVRTRIPALVKNSARKDGMAAARKALSTLPRYAGNGTRAEDRNLRAVCYAQIRARVVALAIKLGHTPTTLELTANGIYPRTIVHTYQMSLSGFMESLGMTPNKHHCGCAKGRQPRGTTLPMDFRRKYGAAA